MLIAAITLIWVVFGFIFAYRNKREEYALLEARAVRRGRSGAVVRKAVEALGDYETARDIHEAPEVVAEKQRLAASQALHAVGSLQGLRATPRILAVAAVDRAMRSQAQVQRLLAKQAPETEIFQAKNTAEEDALHAIAEIRQMMLVKRDGYLNEETD